MWTSNDFKTYPKQFDFSDSGLGKPTFTSLKIGGVEVINMIEGLEDQIDEEQVFQSIICDYCGTAHCSSGNWIAIRQIDNYILFIPAFFRMLDDEFTGEYNPPFSVCNQGALYLTFEDFNLLKSIVPAFRPIEDVTPLTIFEAISLYKWETPHRMFGDFPDFHSMRTNHILTTSELNANEIERIISEKLTILENGSIFHFAPLERSDECISVLLNNKETTEWQPLCKTESGYELHLGGFKIISTPK